MGSTLLAWPELNLEGKVGRRNPRPSRCTPDIGAVFKALVTVHWGFNGPLDVVSAGRLRLRFAPALPCVLCLS